MGSEMCIRDRMSRLNKSFGFEDLSMGMSSDYLVAIQQGATMIRIGTGIFGARK